jgi:uncharacterized protein YkwD
MANPTAQEQELLELINRMRLHPQAELQILLDSSDPAIKQALSDFHVNIDTLKAQWAKLTTAVAPIAWSSELNQIAAGHNQAMINSDTQSHQVAARYDSQGNLITPAEKDFATRLKDGNYTYTIADENIYAYGQSVLDSHAGFAIDWGNNPDGSGIQNPAGHREAILATDVREVGISITPENDPITNVGSFVVTEDFGNRAALNNKAWLLGVAFQDTNKDGWYEAGEGLKDITVKITGISGTNFSDTINVADAGGYQELLDPGKYQVDFIRAGNIVGTQTTSIDPTNPNNVKLDLVLPVTNLGANSNPQPTPVVNSVPSTTTQGIDTSQQVTAPLGADLQTGQTGTNLLDFTAQTGKTIGITFGVSADAAYHNYGGFYQVEDTKGTVIDTDGKSYLPTDAGYLTAALHRAQVDIDRNSSGSTTNLQGGHIYAPFMVANGNINDVLNSKNPGSAPHVYFNYTAANADGIDHIRMVAGSNKFGFEDIFGGGDRDYNDLIVQVNPQVL